MAQLPEILSPALTVEDLCVATREGKVLLRNVNFGINPAEFVVIIGPSGCGKSTLIKALAAGKGTSGSISRGFGASSTPIGYLPQRSSLHESLTVGELLDVALKLRTRLSASQRANRISDLLNLCGASSLEHQKAGSLSGGQQRRIALAELLTSNPDLLLLDELTSGLDPNADREIMHVLAGLVRSAGKTILLVTHSVRNLELADHVLMLKEGSLVYDGPPASLLGDSGAQDIEELYALPLAAHLNIESPGVNAPITTGEKPVWGPKTSTPSVVSQFWTLLLRQWLLFFRDRGQMALHLALIITFPLLVVLFAVDGLPLIKSLPLNVFATPPLEAITQQAQWKESSFRAGSLVSGLAMFQIILLTLMGANNGAREIAKEQDINEKEFAAGVHPLAYIAQKTSYVALLSLVQASWMAWLVSEVCGFPGSLGEKTSILFVLTLAVSSCCLAISAASSTPERASLLSIYLVGFQLPLSGAVLALPELARLCFQPFISAYWGWSGYLRSFVDSTYYDVASQVTRTNIASFDLAVFVLLVHSLVGIVGAYFLLKRNGTAY